MYSNSLSKQHQLAQMPSSQSRLNKKYCQQVTSFHLNVNHINTKVQNFYEKPKIITIYDHEPNNNHIIETRGINQDFLDGEDLWRYQQFSVYLDKLSPLCRIEMLIDIFNHMKKWYCIYGLVMFTECMFLIKTPHKTVFSNVSRQTKMLILYLSKKQPMEWMVLQKQLKQRMVVRQFLIMFGKFLFQGEKLWFQKFSEVECFLHNMKSQHNSSLLSSRFRCSQTENQIKNANMTGSNIKGEKLICNSFSPNNVMNKSMTVIEEKSSEYSSPRKLLTTSGFMEKGKGGSQQDVFKQEMSCYDINVSADKAVTKHNNDCLKPQGVKTIVQSRPTSYRTPNPLISKVKFTYSNPQPYNTSLTQPLSTTRSFKIAQRPFSVNTIKFHFISPCQQNQIEEQKCLQQRTSPVSTLQVVANEQYFGRFSSVSREKRVNNVESAMQKMKNTASTLNTYQNSSSHNISPHSVQLDKLRVSVSSDNFCPYISSPKEKHFQEFLISQSFQSHIDTKSYSGNKSDFCNKASHNQQTHFTSYAHKLSGTVHAFNFNRVNIFDVQEVQETNKSEERFTRIVEQLHIETDNHTYQMNEIEKQLEDLFGDENEYGEDGEQDDDEIDKMIDQFEAILFD